MCTCAELTVEHVQDVFRRALASVAACDRRLGGPNIPGKHRVSEQAIVGRIAHYMATELDCAESDDANHVRVDVEYNRHGDGMKQPPPGFDKSWMAVDLCVHVRRTDERNLLVVEAKPVDGEGEYDRAKLSWLTRQKKKEGEPEPFRYALGAGLSLSGTVSWFQDGEEVGKETFEGIVEG